MRSPRRWWIAIVVAVCGGSALLTVSCGDAGSGLSRVNHILILMQENHSFDNYFGALAYSPGSPYHNGNGSCASGDHACVDGLTCSAGSGGLACTNSNVDDDASTVLAFKAATLCPDDLDHTWRGTHAEVNFGSPNGALLTPLMDGFVTQNDLASEIDSGESADDDQTMSFYDQADLPFYYDLAAKFAISDRYFASVLGPTFPNRSYLMAATSFGHLTSSDSIPPTGGYKPVTGTIFDLLDGGNVSWADYYEEFGQDLTFRPVELAHEAPMATFFQQASGNGTLPQVALLDLGSEDDEHPPADIQVGQYAVAQIVSALRNGPYWKDSILFIMYDEHGGFYDHVKPPQAPQNAARTPDGIYPGQCEDLSSPPESMQPGGGAECASNGLGGDTSLADAEALCPAMASDPTGAYPASCAAFDQLGVRVPLMVISPFAKPAYVSHAVADHTSLLAFIEKRFLHGKHLTLRDQYANDLEDMFDFEHSPSLNTPVGTVQPPQSVCSSSNR